MKTQSGFTLVEALVAMTILAVSAASLIGASEINTRRIDGLEARAASGWVAQNHLAELQVTGLIGTDLTIQRDMLGRDWRVDVLTKATDQPDLTRVTILVFPNDSSGNSDTPMSTYTGFIDTGRRQ